MTTLDLTPRAWIHVDAPICTHLAYHKGDCAHDGGAWTPLFEVEQVRAILLEHMAELSVLTSNVGRLLEITKDLLRGDDHGPAEPVPQG